MENTKCILLLSFATLLLAILFSYSSLTSNFLSTSQTLPSDLSKFVSNSQPQVYIVHVSQPKNAGSLSAEERESWHGSFLPSTHLSSGEPRLVYSYDHAISGFAARLTAEEVKAMESKDGFLGAYPSEEYVPDTTYSQSFLGLRKGEGLWSSTNYGAGVIIGILDTGIAPDHDSFKDGEMPDLPKEKRKSRPCNFMREFTCNKKIIGAVGYEDGEEIPANDEKGHGTHCASVASGSFVADASVLGNALGTASGTAPFSHLVIYKVCKASCKGHDILRAVEQAIEDGVDVLSISRHLKDEKGNPRPFYKDSFAIGSFALMQRGVFISMAASNAGPKKGSVFNTFPWVLTVGASTVDRTLLATAKLGNGDTLNGESANKRDELMSTELVYPGMGRGDKEKTCSKDSLNPVKVKDKIVICHYGGETKDPIDKGKVVKEAEAKAMILITDELFPIRARPHVLPTIEFGPAESKKIMTYVNKNRNPTAILTFKGERPKTPVSPMVSASSGRGPAPKEVGILKPDIIGPGVNILVASPFTVGPDSTDPPTDSKNAFTMVSGTSFSTPHLAGVAALLIGSHANANPKWSPAMIKSAIMTSSSIENQNKEKIRDEEGALANLFATGAGHVEPAKANNPGLVYDIKPDDYIRYLCGLPEYTDKKVRMVIRGSNEFRCSDLGQPIAAKDLNYPSIALYLTPKAPPVKVTRTVRNVGNARSNYDLKVDGLKGISVMPSRKSISFLKVNDEVSYDLDFKVDTARKGTVVEGHVEWTTMDPKTFKPLIVRSAVSVTVI